MLKKTSRGKNLNEKGEPRVGGKGKLTKKVLSEIWGVQIYKLFQNERDVESTDGM